VANHGRIRRRAVIVMCLGTDCNTDVVVASQDMITPCLNNPESSGSRELKHYAKALTAVSHADVRWKKTIYCDHISFRSVCIMKKCDHEEPKFASLFYFPFPHSDGGTITKMWRPRGLEFRHRVDIVN
jgi:hypothetical protein